MNIRKLKEILKKIIGVLMYAIFLILFISGVILFGYFVKVKTDISKGIYEKPKYNAFIIISQSMTPTIKINDAIITKKVLGKDLKVNDIITFVSQDSHFSGFTITHRIIEKTISTNGNYIFKTKGDYNNVVDSTTINENDIIGKTIFKIPMVGYIQYFLSTSFGWIIAILIPSLTIIIYDLVILIKKIYQKKKPKKKTKKSIKRKPK